MSQKKIKIVTASRRHDDDFSLPAGDSRCRRRLKRTGAVAPVLTGAWGRSATNKLHRVYTGALLAVTGYSKTPTEVEISPLYGGYYEKMDWIRAYVTSIGGETFSVLSCFA